MKDGFITAFFGVTVVISGNLVFSQTSAIRYDDTAACVLSAEEIVSSPNFTRDVYRSIEIYPGVATQGLSAKPVIEGGHPDETAIILDNLILFEPFHGHDFYGMFGVVNPNLVGNIKLAKGGFSAKYSDRMSGVLEINTVDQIKDFKSSFTADLVSASFFMNRRLRKKVSFFASARLGYMGSFFFPERDFQPFFIDLWKKNSSYEIEFKNKNAPADFFDLWSKLEIKLNSRNKLAVNVLGAGDNFEYIREFANTKGEYYVSSRHSLTTWLNWDHLWHRRFHSATTLGFQSFWKKADFFLEQSQRDGNQDRSQINVLSVLHKNKWLPSARHLVEFGLELHTFRGDYLFDEIRLDQTRTTADSVFINTIHVDTGIAGALVSGYAQDTWQLSKKLNVQLGFRLSSQSFTKGAQLAPRAALKYQLSQKIAARLAYGWYYQPDNFNRMKTYQGQTRLLKIPEKSIHYKSGLSFKNKVIDLSLEAYYKDYVTLFDDFKFDLANRFELASLDQPFNVKKGYSTGITFFVRKEFPRSSFARIAYTFGRNRIQNAFGTTTRRDFDRTHSVVITAVFPLLNGVRLSALWRYYTGPPFTPNQINLLGENPFENSFVYFDVETKNSRRLPAFHSLDVKLEKGWHIGKMRLTSFVNLFNLYDHRNVRNYFWESTLDENGFTGFQIDKNRLLDRLYSVGASLSY
ncbi:MAG: TonB-dependent receptor plug domain-containing protein [bacterium]